MAGLQHTTTINDFYSHPVLELLYSGLPSMRPDTIQRLIGIAVGEEGKLYIKVNSESIPLTLENLFLIPHVDSLNLMYSGCGYDSKEFTQEDILMYFVLFKRLDQLGVLTPELIAQFHTELVTICGTPCPRMWKGCGRECRPCISQAESWIHGIRDFYELLKAWTSTEITNELVFQQLKSISSQFSIVFCNIRKMSRSVLCLVLPIPETITSLDEFKYQVAQPICDLLKSL